MLLSEFKNLVQSRLEHSFNKVSDEHLANLTLEALVYVASRCEPSVLLRNADSNERVLRAVRNNHFLAMPDKPDFSNANEHLMIDEALSYAVLNYVCFVLSKDERKFFDLANAYINEYIANDGKELEFKSSLSGY